MIALYARQSVERENSVSIETQLDYCRSMIRPNEDTASVAVYRDEGASGGNTNRPDFQRMMRDIRSGKIRKVITYKLDRISRSLYDFVGILRTFEEYNVKFISSQEAFDTDSIYGNLILKILMVFAEFERTSIINRVRDAYDKRTDMGIYMGGRRQYGFQLKETKVHGIQTKIYEIIPTEAEQVRLIFEMYAQESVTLRRILSNLTENGIKPLVGKDWTTAKLSGLLKNPVYVMADSQIYEYFESRGVRIVNDISEFDGSKGAFLYGKTTHDDKLNDWSDMKLVLGGHGGLITAEIWLRCQRKIEKNKQVGNSLSNHTSWLAGKPVCDKCGHTMTTIRSRRKDGSERRYFVCTGRSHKKMCSGIACTVYVDDLEQIAQNYITEKLKSLGNIRKRDGANEGEQNRLRLKLAEIEQQKKRLGRLLMDEGLNHDLLSIANQQASELSRQRQILLEQMNEVRYQETEINVALYLSKQWKKANFEEKRSTCGILIDRIILHEDGTPEFVWNI